MKEKKVINLKEFLFTFLYNVYGQLKIIFSNSLYFLINTLLLFNKMYCN